VVRWLRHEAMQEVLDAIGLPPFEVLFTLAHGAPFTEDADEGGDRLAVTLHDDCITTMEFVVKALATCFDLDDEGARHLMQRVHEDKMATVATFALADARARVIRARAMARAELMPLRITTRPAAE